MGIQSIMYLNKHETRVFRRRAIGREVSMEKVKVEFINTCSCCDGYGDVLRELAARHPQQIDLKIYYMGKDFDYLSKYGVINRGTLIINEKNRFDDLSRRVIEKAVKTALDEVND